MTDESENKILVPGDPGCQHSYVSVAREWDEIQNKTGDPVKDKNNTWNFNGHVAKCTKCGREKLLGGNIIVPRGGDASHGEYVLDPDGSRGPAISDYS